MKSFISFIIVCLVFSSYLYAEKNENITTITSSKPVNLGKIIVSARGYISETDKIPGGTGVISRSDIEKIQPNSITNALQVIPGVTKSSDSAWGSEVNIRGTSRSKVVFLIDDIRLNTATDIGAQFGTVDPMSVERVEILKGPISALYGSGSIGGVVNVITRNGEFSDKKYNGGGLNILYDGNTSGFNSYAYSSYNSPDFYFFVSGSYRDHESYKDGNGIEMKNSQFTDGQAVLNMGIKPNDISSIELKTQYYKGDEIGIPGAGSVGFPQEARVTYDSVDRMLLNLNYTLNPESEVYKQSKIRFSYHSIERYVRVDNLPAPMGTFMKSIEPEAAHRTYGTSFSNRFKFNDHDISTGVDAWIRTLSGERVRTKLNGETSVDTPLPDSRYISAGLFAEDEWKPGRLLSLNFGGRFDRIQVKNEETYLYKTAFDTPPPPPSPNTVIWDKRDITEYSWNAHCGLTYFINNDWSSNFLMARGYRAASLEERYKYLNLGSGIEKWGNPELEPEESLFFEYGLKRTGEIFDLGASFYYNQLDNLIAEKRVSDTRIELQNIDEAELYGGEFEFTVRYFRWVIISGNIAYTRGRDTKNNADLPSIPPFNGFLSMRFFPAAGLWTQIDAVYNDSQKKVPSGQAASKKWTRLDITAGYKFSLGRQEHEIFSAVDNLFNRLYLDYLTTSRGFTFNEPGRSFRIGYRIDF